MKQINYMLSYRQDYTKKLTMNCSDSQKIRTVALKQTSTRYMSEKFRLSLNGDFNQPLDMFWKVHTLI